MVAHRASLLPSCREMIVLRRALANAMQCLWRRGFLKPQATTILPLYHHIKACGVRCAFTAGKNVRICKSDKSTAH